MNTAVDIDAAIHEAEVRCKEHGARLTDKRKQVLAGLLSSPSALSAYELVDYCKAQYGRALPAMSVYRILEFLESQHLVHKLNLANKYVACAHITCDHDHGVPQFLICGNCQRVEEIRLERSTMNALERTVDAAGFQLVSPQLEINCLCNECREQLA